jgi:hypothetical protein
MLPILPPRRAWLAFTIASAIALAGLSLVPGLGLAVCIGPLVLALGIQLPARRLGIDSTWRDADEVPGPASTVMAFMPFALVPGAWLAWRHPRSRD